MYFNSSPSKMRKVGALKILVLQDDFRGEGRCRPLTDLTSLKMLLSINATVCCNIW